MTLLEESTDVKMLLPHHRQLIENSSISSDVAAARGYESITVRQRLLDLGFTKAQARVPGLLIPLWRVDGEPGGYQFRPDTPRELKGKPLKYESPRGQANVLDVPPTVRESLHQGLQAILITEGVRKADALASLGIPCINVAGVYGWRGKNSDGGYTALADWEEINIKGSIFVLTFDSDILTKAPVYQALRRSKSWLEHKGAKQVRVLVLPNLLSGKTGVDDYIAETRATVEDLARLVVNDLPKPPTEAVPEPDGDPINLSAVLDDVRGLIMRYVVLEPSQADAVALWVAHTHAIDVAETTPYLAINSAEKRSGKTRLLEILELLVNRPWSTGRTTAAALSRKVDKTCPSLLLDESDAAFKGDKEYSETLRGCLNTGHRRGGKVTVCTGQGANIDFVDLSTFCPKAIAGIGKLPDTVADRAIPILLKRRRPNEIVARFKHRKANLEAASLRKDLAAWARQAVAVLCDVEPDIPDELDDRASDGWEPLLVIADAAGEVWTERGRRAALALSAAENREDDSMGVRLLADVHAVFEEKSLDRLSTSALLEGLAAMDEAPWSEWYGKPIAARGLAKLLKPFGIKPHGIRIGDKTPKGYTTEGFQDAWARYTPLLYATTPQAESVSETGRQKLPERPHVADCGGYLKPVLVHSRYDVAGVADSKVLTGAKDDEGEV